MKDTQTWISMLIGVGYMIFKIIRFIGEHKSEPVHQPHWEHEDENEDEDEILSEWEEIKSPIEKIKDLARHEQETITSLPTVKKASVPTKTSHQLISNPSYPGIQKLLLPTQEQNPYKLYQATTTRHRKKLSQILHKHSTSHQAIIMAELLQRKT